MSEASIEALVTGTKSGLTLDTMLSVLRTTMAWNNALAIAMPKRPLAGDFTPGFMMKLAHKDCRLALQMVDGLGVIAPVGHAALASLEEGIAPRTVRTTTSARCSSCARSPSACKVRLRKPLMTAADRDRRNGGSDAW